MSELNKQEIKWLKENWKEIVGILYNNIDEKDLFEVLLMDYAHSKGLFSNLELIIQANKNWFTSNINFKTKVALLKEILGQIFFICEYCGNIELFFEEIEESQKVEITCKACNNKLNEMTIQNPEF